VPAVGGDRLSSSSQADASIKFANDVERRGAFRVCSSLSLSKNGMVKDESNPATGEGYHLLSVPNQPITVKKINECKFNVRWMMATKASVGGGQTTAPCGH
jgi:hypothetical protein